MTTTNDKFKAITVSLVAHDQGRLSDEELKIIAKVIDPIPTNDVLEDEE